MLDVSLPSLGSLGCLWIGFFECLHVGVVFFPSLPFMGVMLFPSTWLGDALRGWGGGGGGGGGWPFASNSSFFFFFFFLQLCHLLLLLSPLSPSFSPLLCLLSIMSFSFVSFPLLSLFFFFYQQLSLPAHQPFSPWEDRLYYVY